MVQSLDDQAIEVVTYPKGTTLFRQGDAGDAAFIVNSGSVGIYREVEGKRIPLASSPEDQTQWQKSRICFR